MRIMPCRSSKPIGAEYRPKKRRSRKVEIHRTRPFPHSDHPVCQVLEGLPADRSETIPGCPSLHQWISFALTQTLTGESINRGQSLRHRCVICFYHFNGQGGLCYEKIVFWSCALRAD